MIISFPSSFHLFFRSSVVSVRYKKQVIFDNSEEYRILMSDLVVTFPV